LELWNVLLFKGLLATRHKGLPVALFSSDRIIDEQRWPSGDSLSACLPAISLHLGTPEKVAKNQPVLELKLYRMAVTPQLGFTDYE
jgi:hypothetical protein